MAEQAGLSLTWLETPKTGILVTRLIWYRTVTTLFFFFFINHCYYCCQFYIKIIRFSFLLIFYICFLPFVINCLHLSFSHWKFMRLLIEPCHEIMVLFILRKLILQTQISSHPVGLDVWFLVDLLSTSILHVCEQQRLWRDCSDALLVACVISTIISWAGSIMNKK